MSDSRYVVANAIGFLKEKFPELKILDSYHGSKYLGKNEVVFCLFGVVGGVVSGDPSRDKFTHPSSFLYCLMFDFGMEEKIREGVPALLEEMKRYDPSSNYESSYEFQMEADYNGKKIKIPIRCLSITGRYTKGEGSR